MLKIADTFDGSITDGTGLRYVIFVQGCAHECKGCHNPETWDFNCGKNASTEDLFNEITEDPIIDGITFSGGDPMYQAKECTELAKLIKEKTDLSIWCYTGFTYEEVLKDKSMSEFLNYIDVLVDGLFINELKSLELDFKGSSNQRVIDIKETRKRNSIVTLY